VWTDVTEILKDKQHIAQKPERLYEIVVEAHTKPGDLVIDMFGGSGTCAVVCERLGRRWVVVEQDRESVDKIRQRLDAPGK
jgi:adenine-specific DNA-methyltransferase